MARRKDPDPGKPCDFGPPGRNHRASFAVVSNDGWPRTRKSCGQHLQEAVLWAMNSALAIPAVVYDLEART
jgi:hypothetical protein